MFLRSFIPRCKDTKFSAEMQVFSKYFLQNFKQFEFRLQTPRIYAEFDEDSGCKLIEFSLQTIFSKYPKS
jgi:hypothetical protein